MGKILEDLRSLLIQRASFRIMNPIITSYRIHSRIPSEKTLRSLGRKLKLEKEVSEDLNENQACYRDFNHTLQITMETYSDIRGSGSHTIAPADLEDAIEALRYLEEGAALFRMRVRRLLHTVFLPDYEAWEYLMILMDHHQSDNTYGN
jgi:hypothetical protein